MRKPKYVFLYQENGEYWWAADVLGELVLTHVAVDAFWANKVDWAQRFLSKPSKEMTDTFLAAVEEWRRGIEQ